MRKNSGLRDWITDARRHDRRHTAEVNCSKLYCEIIRRNSIPAWRFFDGVCLLIFSRPLGGWCARVNSRDSGLFLPRQSSARPFPKVIPIWLIVLKRTRVPEHSRPIPGRIAAATSAGRRDAHGGQSRVIIISGWMINIRADDKSRGGKSARVPSDGSSGDFSEKPRDGPRVRTVNKLSGESPRGPSHGVFFPRFSDTVRLPFGS